MAEAQAGQRVRVHYSGRLDDASEFDSSGDGEPLELTIGEGEALAPFENALVGMSPGDSKTIIIPADDAHGAHSADLVREVPRDKVPNVEDVEVGVRISATLSGGMPVHLKVLQISDATVTVDLNHPLAGLDLTYEITLVEIL